MLVAIDVTKIVQYGDALDAVGPKTPEAAKEIPVEAIPQTPRTEAREAIRALIETPGADGQAEARAVSAMYDLLASGAGKQVAEEALEGLGAEARGRVLAGCMAQAKEVVSSAYARKVADDEVADQKG